MRNGTVLQGGDSILLIALFWSVFLPLEAAWSVDAAARPRENQARLVLNWGSVALVLQLFIIYVVSGVLKSRMGYWQRGEGVYNALSADHFVTPFGEWLYQFEDLLVGMNHGTLVLEMCAPLLLFVPFAFGPVRTALVVLFMGFHAGLGLSIDLGLFPWVSAAVWLFALPSWFWDQLDRRLGATRLANWVARLAVCAEAPVAALVRLRATANRPFVAIATLATRLSWSRLVQLFGAASLAYVSMLALGEVESDFAPKGALAKPKSWFRISQGWRMFVPPYRDAGWFVAVGTRADGKTVEVLFGSGKEVTWERPRYVAAMFPDQRWRKYLVNLRKARFARHRKRLAGYLCRDWNETHAGESAIESVELVYLKRTIKLHGKRGQVQRDSWTRQRCRDG
jgi:hypothetical protein